VRVLANRAGTQRRSSDRVWGLRRGQAAQVLTLSQHTVHTSPPFPMAVTCFPRPLPFALPVTSPLSSSTFPHPSPTACCSILNRFSGDVGTVDGKLPVAFSNFLVVALRVLATMVRR